MKSKTLTIADIPKKYKELISFFPLRPIKDSVNLNNALEIVDAMAGYSKLTADQNDFLHALSILVHDYESEHTKLPRVSGMESLKFLMEEHGMKPGDLAGILGLSPSMGSKILNGDRALTVQHIQTLAQRFCVNPSLFL